MKKGFTLIELMIAVSIIAILTAIVVTNFSQAKGRSRDAKRISDVGQLQLALELFFDRCGQYPAVASGAVSLTSSCTTFSGASIPFSTYISVIPVPPTSALGTTKYDYSVSNDTGGHPINYVLHTQLESYNEIIKDGLTAFPSTGTWSSTLVCDQTLNNYCLGPK